MDEYANPYPYPLVLVTWADAVSQSGWHAAEDLSTPTIVHTIGWRVRDDKFGLAIAATVGDAEELDKAALNQIMVIPRGMVMETLILAEAHDG